MYIPSGGGVFVSAGYSVLKLNIGWEKVAVGQCRVFDLYMIDEIKKG
jgi:hypothetical protein